MAEAAEKSCEKFSSSSLGRMLQQVKVRHHHDSTFQHLTLSTRSSFFLMQISVTTQLLRACFNVSFIRRDDEELRRDRRVV